MYMYLDIYICLLFIDTICHVDTYKYCYLCFCQGQPKSIAQDADLKIVRQIELYPYARELGGWTVLLCEMMKPTSTRTQNNQITVYVLIAYVNSF